MVDFLDLGCSEVFVTVFKITAGIDHVGVKPLLVELVGDVVVVADGFCVDLAVVASTEIVAEFGCCRGGWSIEDIGQGIAHGDHVVQCTLYFDFAFDIGGAEVVQRRFQQIAQGFQCRYSDDDLGGFIRAEIVFLSGPQFQTQR